VAKKNYLPMQAGDVPVTYANIEDLIKDCGLKPTTSIETGVECFVEWYKKYNNI
jgi:UDP-glucuronate 4-epimerase